MGLMKNEFIRNLEADHQFIEDCYYDSDLWNYCDPDYPDVGEEDYLSSMLIVVPLMSSVLEDVPF